MPFCMKELDTCETNEHVIFNNMLRSARNPIECAFGRLKARWRILTKKIDFKLEKVPVIIYSCFVLHNFCEENNMAIDHDVVCNQIEIMKANEREFENNIGCYTAWYLYILLKNQLIFQSFYYRIYVFILNF